MITAQNAAVSVFFSSEAKCKLSKLWNQTTSSGTMPVMISLSFHSASTCIRISLLAPFISAQIYLSTSPYQVCERAAFHLNLSRLIWWAEARKRDLWRLRDFKRNRFHWEKWNKQFCTLACTFRGNTRKSYETIISV